MTRRLLLVVLAAAPLAVGTQSCSSGSEAADDVPGGRTPAAGSAGANARRTAQARSRVEHGRFGDAVPIGKNRWKLLNNKPRPAERDEFAIDDDDGDGGGAGGSGGGGGGNGSGAGGGDGGGRRSPGGEQKKRFGQSPLYVDGVAVAVVAYGELPAWLPTRPATLNDGRKVIRFRFAEYLSALGVPLHRVREVHLYGGRGRVGVIPGAELRRVKNQLLFSFTKGDEGKMRMHWDGDIGVSDSIDKVQAVAVYVKRKPPRWDRGKWSMVDDRGGKFEGIPYAEAPLKGGVRVYLDGRIAHVLKRNRTFARKVEPARMVDGVPAFEMFAYLDEMGVKAGRAVAMELLDENRVALRLDGPSLRAERANLELSAPPQSSGRVVVHLGPKSARRSLEVTAINLYTPKRAKAHERR